MSGWEEVPSLLVMATLGVPLVLLVAVMLPATRRVGVLLAPWSALPTVVLGVSAGATVSWPSVLLGMRLYAPDEVTRTYLLFTGVLWLFSGLFARGYLREDGRKASFWGFYLATLMGNVGAVLARDMASFYLFFAMMTFCAYGLVVHSRDERAARAGRVYIIMALVGEVLLLAAFFLIAGTRINLMFDEVPRVVAQSPERTLICVLILAGFGVKVGVLLLHMWLPLAHPVAPAPGSAVLSGTIIKVGVLGWLRFLPLGEARVPEVGQVCVALGLTASFYGVLVGLTQKEAKTVLAYSSISQMGFLTLAVGLALSAPEAAPVLVGAVLVYAAHHSLAKGLLFLGAGLVHETGRRGWRAVVVWVGLVWAGLEISGAPLTSGALAKLSLKSAEAVAHAPEVVPTLLSLAAVGSTLIMARFLVRVLPDAPEQGTRDTGGMWLSWVVLLAVDTALLVWPPVGSEFLPKLLEPKNLWSSAWPVAVGVGLSAVAWRLGRSVPEIPAGDVLWPLSRLVLPGWRLLTRGAEREESTPSELTVRTLRWFARLRDLFLREVSRGEEGLSRLSSVGFLLLVFLGVFLFLLVR
ncbi:complex I subunit 5 family protein [Myxococcus sp. K38C18041901]|uniref:complex I subunit 5 family protein n=1 Tax=Myxococcus guangdongensis TaxID=2906760 RepID=UPI0020A7CF0B|nr:complex I subunit 5 family protein [Myxococcus guangdongensis]MCP3063969.1 complex I subunit 5 family protein [Myxococcus guangdongensis]